MRPSIGSIVVILTPAMSYNRFSGSDAEYDARIDTRTDELAQELAEFHHHPAQL